MEDDTQGRMPEVVPWSHTDVHSGAHTALKPFLGKWCRPENAAIEQTVSRPPSSLHAEKGYYFETKRIHSTDTSRRLVCIGQAIALPTSTKVIFLLGKIPAPLHTCKPNVLLETPEAPGSHQ